MSQVTKRRAEREAEPVWVLGRGLRAQRGVHLTMRTLREAAGKTQAEVAEASKIDQADISRLESRENFTDCQVSTLERYVAALGGQLELVATFGDRKIVLAGTPPGCSGDFPQSLYALTACQNPPRRSAGEAAGRFGVQGAVTSLEFCRRRRRGAVVAFPGAITADGG
jgi:transcriptional regulator with XRE-family HTH domain